MTFSLPHSVKFSGMVQRSLCLLCFIGIFVMVVGLYKPWICVTISTMVLHPLKLPGCRNGSGKFKACILRNFSRRLKLTTFPITIATQERLGRQKMSAPGFRAGVGAVAPQGWAAGLGSLGFQSGNSMGGGAGLEPAPQGWAGKGISLSWKCILWEILCPAAQAHPFFSQTLPGGNVCVCSWVRLLPSPV